MIAHDVALEKNLHKVIKKLEESWETSLWLEINII